MKYGILTILTLCICSCVSSNKSYEKAIDACRQEKYRKQQELLESGKRELFFQGLECVFNTKVPAFEAKTLEGRNIDIKYFKGKTTILNFWFTTCSPCIAEIPGFNALVEKYGKEKFNYLAIGRDTPSDIEEFLQKHPWDFDIIPAGEAIIQETFKTMWGYPTTMVLDKNGIIVGGFFGGKTDSTAVQQVQDKVEAILAKM